MQLNITFRHLEPTEAVTAGFQTRRPRPTHFDVPPKEASPCS